MVKIRQKLSSLLFNFALRFNKYREKTIKTIWKDDTKLTLFEENYLEKFKRKNFLKINKKIELSKLAKWAQ